MKALTLRLSAVAALLPLALATSSFAAAITQIRVYSSQTTGAFTGIDLWDTNPGGNFNLGVYENLSPMRGVADIAASVDIPVGAGTNTFELAGEPGTIVATYDLQVYFDNAPLPQLSVIVPLTLPNQVGGSFTVNGAFGGTSFNSGGNTYTITSFEWMRPDVNNIDLVGPFTLGADGANDYIGTFTIVSSPTVSQAAPEPASLSLLAIGGLTLLRRRKR